MDNEVVLTAAETAEKWDLSPRRVSVLCAEGRIEGALKKGKTWLIPAFSVRPKDLRLRKIEDKITLNTEKEPDIQNRRFLGNKYKLVDFIDEVITENCKDSKSFLDIFAGTGVVASHFADRMDIITNDILYSNYISHIAFLSSESVNVLKLKTYINLFNKTSPEDLLDNYMSINFGDTYYSKNDCKKIGYIREEIESLFNRKAINSRERAILITTLLYAMDKIANTCGHYDAYIKGSNFDKNLELRLIKINDNSKNRRLFYNGDSNTIIREKGFPDVDCVYCDPPYNSRNYCDLYHLLENVAKWEKPEVVGVAKKMDRSALKSEYCSKQAAKAFEDLVDNLNCKYILLSYNNTGNKANARSNARMSDNEIIRILKKRGEVKIFSKKYKAFTTGKSNNNGNEERIFLCIVKKKINGKRSDKAFIKSPLNYVGGKTKLLPQLYPLFPKDINTFVDLFCGGGNVGININANKVIYNDSDKNVIRLLEYFKNIPSNNIESEIEKIILKYGLSDSKTYGYEKYGCNSSAGLASYNKSRYLSLRKDYNESNKQDLAKLLTLITFGFNNQIRFNSKGEYNLPVGKRDFNSVIRNNLNSFSNMLKKQNATILGVDFRVFDISMLGREDFVYCDPPYLITNATYNEKGGWKEIDEKDLLKLLDRLNYQNVRFALSNVIEHNGKRNEILMNWATKYNINRLNYSYNNSNYHSSAKNHTTKEVLITNY